MEPRRIAAERERLQQGAAGLGAEALSELMGGMRAISGIVKAPFVIASPEPDACFSGPLNSFQGVVTRLQTDGTCWELRGALDDGAARCSLMAYATRHSTPLKLGGMAWFSFRPLSVILIAE